MSELTWAIEPKLYLLANGQQWWQCHAHPGLIEAAVHGKRSDGQRVFKVISLAASASVDLKTQAQAYALKVLGEKGLQSDDLLIQEGTIMPAAEAYP